MRRSALLLAAVLCAPICRAAPPPAPNKRPAAAVSMPGFCIFGGQSGKTFGDLAGFKALVWKNDVLYVGCGSGLPACGRARLDVLRAMREARGSRIVVGFDALDIPLQPVLDDYAAGRITEEDFLQRTDWNRNLSVDFAHYKPLFDFIIQNKLRALALNVPKTLIFKIERFGLSALGDEDRRVAPDQIAVSKNVKYLGALRASFEGRSDNANGLLTWENYLSAVSAWNETAGSGIAGFINANPGWAALALTENERLLYNAALPASVKSRTAGLRQASFYTEDSARCPASLPKARKDLANYIWFIGLSTGATAGK